MAPPIPCRIRMSVNWVSVWEAPQSSEAMVNVAMAAANTDREPKRSATQPLIGMNTEGQQVSRHADVQADSAGVETVRHLRQSRRNDGAVQVFHEEGAGDERGYVERRTALLHPCCGLTKIFCLGSF